MTAGLKMLVQLKKKIGYLVALKFINLKILVN